MAENLFLKSPKPAAKSALVAPPIPEFDFPTLKSSQGTAPSAAASMSQGLVPPPDLEPLFAKASADYGVPINVLSALADQESKYRTDAVGEPTKYGRAKGIMQYIDDTAKGMGINAFDPAQSIDAAAKQFKQRLDKGYSVAEAIAAHHGGDDRAQWGPKTKAYVESVMGKAGTIDQEMMAHKVLGEVQNKPDIAKLQAEADAEEPGRYKVLTAEDAQSYQKRIDLASGKGARQDAQKALGAYEAPSPYPVDTQARIEDQVNAMPPLSPLTVTNQDRVRAGIAPKEDLPPDGFVSATGKALKNVPGHFKNAAGGLISSFGERVDDQTLVSNAQNAGIIDRMKENGTITMVQDERGNFTPTLPDGKPGDISAVASYIRKNAGDLMSPEEAGNLLGMKPSEVAKYGRKLSKEANRDELKVNPDGPLAKYGSMIIGSTTEMVPAILAGVVTKNPNLALGLIGGQVYGQSYDQGRQGKLNPQDAATYAMLQAAAEAIPEALPLHFILKPGQNFFRGVFTAGAAEAAQEAVTQVIQSGLDKGSINPNMTWAEARQQLIDATIVGAGSGMALRAGVHGLQKGMDAIPSRDREAEAAAAAAQGQPAPAAEAAPEGAPAPNPAPEASAQPAPAPAGTLTAAAAKVTQTPGADRVTVQTSTGPITGTMELFTPGEKPEEWEARILSDDGQLHHFSEKDGVVINREAQDDIPTLTDVFKPEPMAADTLTPFERNQLRAAGVTDEQLGTMTAEQGKAAVAQMERDGTHIPTLTDQVDGPIPTLTDVVKPGPIPTLTDVVKKGVDIPTLTDKVEVPTLNDVVEPAGSPDYSAMDEPQLRAELKNTAAAIKEQPKNASLKAQRKAIEKALAGNAKAAPEVVTPPAEVKAVKPPAPLAETDGALTDEGTKPVKWFGSQAKAEGYLFAKGQSETHEVVDVGKSRFEVREKAAVPAPVETPKAAPTNDDKVVDGFNRLTRDLQEKQAKAATNTGDAEAKREADVAERDLANYVRRHAKALGQPEQAEAAPAKAAPAAEVAAAKKSTPKQRAKALKEKRQENVRATLGVKEGEQFTMSADVGYATAGRTYTLTEIGSDGSAYITGEGGRTDLSKADLIAAVNKGVTFSKVGTASNTEAEKPASTKAATSTAPEHAHVGVDDRELNEIVVQFNSAAADMMDDGEQVHHLFDEPKKGEVVRLNDKVKVYTKEHGWMTPAEAKAKIAEWKAHVSDQYDKHRNENSDKVVLSFFDLTGKWSGPWEEAGYQVYRFDIQDDPEMGDVHNFSAEFFNDWFSDFDGNDIYAILAACPCTDFAVSGARHFAAKDEDGRTVASVKLVHQTLAAIEHFKPAVWAIENPVGRIEKLGGLPSWRLSFDPYHLGDTYTKKTLIWGRFNGDLPIAPVDPVEGSKMHSQYGGKSIATKNARSATPEGFAYGFFMANNAIDNPVMAIANKYDRLDRQVISDAVAAGMTQDDIGDVVDDFYYMDLDDEGANDALREAIDERAEENDEPTPPPPPAPKPAPKAEQPKPAPKSGPQALGKNKDGKVVFEDENGVRSVADGGVRITESVSMRPTREGMRMSVDTENREARFKTAEELDAKAEADKPAVSENKVFTEDAAAKARAILKAKLNGSQLNAGVDPEILQAGITLAGYHIEKGARTFAAYAKAMTEDLGDMVKPYLKSWYMGVKYDPRAADFDGMSTAGDVEAFNVNEVAPDEPQTTETADPANADGRQPGASQADDQDADAGTVADESDGGLRAESGQREPSSAKSARPKTRPASTEHAPADKPARSPATGKRADQRNYRVQPGELKRTGSWKATAEQNVKIVELVKQILSEKRQATPEEKALLTKFTGWGASEIANGVFPDQYGRYKDQSWQALGERMKAAMSPEEYAQARRSTQYAHYTSEPIIRSVFNALDRLGFNGGQVLEPGMGIGLFNGLMPDSMASNGSYTGIEFDSFTGNISKLLYPESNIIIGDYTQTKLPRDFFDAAIGNPPFGQIKVQADPEYKKQGFLLHDYFFAKTIDRVKPGGLLVFVTSKGTMDKGNDRARKYLMERADLLGAIRLPQTAFKDNAGTEVVTDVIFLRKRAKDELPLGEQWGGLAEVSTAQGPAMVNQYFAANPQMVLGRHAKTGSMYRSDEYTVEPIEGDIEQQFAKAIEHLPEGVYRPQRGSQAEAAAVQRRDYDPKIKKEGGVYVADDGTLMQVDSGQGIALVERTGSDGQPIALKPREVEWLKGYTVVRDALKQAQYDQLNEGKWEASLKALNKAYDAFAKTHGQILAHSVSERETTNEDGTVTTIVTRRFKNEALLRVDAEGALAYALEEIKDDGTIGKGPVLLGRTLNKPSAPTITNTQDAMFVSLNDRGRFDLGHIAQLAGKTEAQVVEELGTAIYQDPSHGWTTADDYLSGNVVRKLKEAEAAARLNKDYARNVEPLKNVQPRALAPQDITVQLGSAWVPPTDIKSFVSEVMGENLSIHYSPKVGQWSVVGSASRVSEWGTGDKKPTDILEGVLNNRQLKVTYKDADGKTHTDAEGTEKVNDIAKKLRAEFRRWIWSDTQRASRLAGYYNENYNNIAPREFDGSHLTLPGVSSRFSLRPHQKRAIWRTIQQGDTYYAHAVGAGKTFTMIASGMEERRLGLSNKPMYVVPNHMLAQFSKEFLELYPTAQIMVADEQNFHTHNRRKFVAQAALNDPDAIVITHSAFGRIGMSAEFSQTFINQQIDDWKSALDEADKSDRVTVKNIEARIEQLENRLKKIIAGEGKDKVLSFEELGVDRLYVDEGHEFRKLDFPTNRGNVKGIDSKGSQRAMDLFMKVSYLREQNPGRALVMASGTPVTNTMGELFTIQRFFQRDQLEEDGDSSFDAWANHYGEVVDGLEQNAAGGYETVSRFAKFINVPELMSRVRSVMDILTSSQLGDLVQRPDIDNGGRQIIVTPSPDGYKAYQKELENRIKAIRLRKGPPVKGADIILNVIADGRFSAIDMRFVDPALPSDPNSKLNRTIDDMIEAYHATAGNEYASHGKPDELPGASQMLFTDIGLGEQSAENRGFDMKAWMKQRLIEGGVKAEHIAFMRDNKAHSKKERLFDDLRNGRKRILIGGKDMETGVNAQKRLTHLFHLDAPWFPASVEQREGRIIRQGNQNGKVIIKAYASKGSYDSTMWGMNARKARFIEQAMSGDSSLRSMEDVSEASAFEMAAALASGDERYMKLAGLKGDVERLGRLYSAHMDEQKRLRSQKMGNEQTTKHNAQQVKALNAAIAKREPIKAGEFAGSVGKKVYDKRDEFSVALHNEFKALAEAYTPGEQELGKIGGFPILYNGVELRGGNFAADMSIDLPGSPDALAVFPLEAGASINGIAQRAANQVNGLEYQVSQREGYIKAANEELAKIDRRLGAAFPEMSELTEKREELLNLESELEAESKANDAAAIAEVAASTAEVEKPKMSVREQEGAPASTEDVREAITKGPFGPVVNKLIASLNVVIHDTAATLPAETDKVAGIQAVTTKNGAVHLVAANLTPATANAVLLHEMFHSGAKALLGNKRWDALMKRLEGLHRQAEQSTGKARNVFDRAAERVAKAKAKGAVADGMSTEEFGAYAIEEYEQLPVAFRAWADDLVGAVKHWLFKRFGAQLGQVTPAQLRALAKDVLLTDPNKLHDPIMFSVAELAPPKFVEKAAASKSVVDTPAFKRWFGKSKVVDASGQPKVMYHGSRYAGISEFNAVGGGATFFSPDPAVAGRYTGQMPTGGPMSNQPTIYPVYLRAENPFDFEKPAHVAALVDAIYGKGTAMAKLTALFGQPLTRIRTKATGWKEDEHGGHWMYEPDMSAPSRRFSKKEFIERANEGDWGMFETREVQAAIKTLGHDGYYTSEHGAKNLAVHSPEQIKSAVGNNGEFDPSIPDIRYSVLPDDTALADATAALDKPGQFKPDIIGELSEDIGRVARFVLHPRQIAALHKEFTPVYNTAIAQFEMRDALIDELQQDHKAYDNLPQEGKAKVNAVLELGRLYSATYPDKALKDGIAHTGTKTVAKIDENGKAYREQQPVQALLSVRGEVHKLNPAEIEAYNGLRAMFDNALDKFKDQTLTDFGLPELAGTKKAAEAVMAMITPATPALKRDRLQGIANFINEIEQAKRSGYVPFARYGDYVVVVKEQKLPLKLIKDTDNGGWITRNLPKAYNTFVEGLGAKFDAAEDGYRLDDEQRKALVSENEQTIHSAKVEFTLRDKLLIKRGRKVQELPSVKKALAEAEKWKEGKPTRRVVAFETIQKQPEGGVKLADVDALAEVAMLDTATWDAVREQLQDAIKGKSFRKHFFQSDNVPGYTADFERAIADYMAGMSGYLARRHYNGAWDNAVKSVKAPRLFEYATKYRAYANEPHEELAMVRQVGFFSYIAGVPATAFANLTQPLLLTLPVLGQVAPHHLVLREMARAYKDALAMARVNKKTGLDFFDPEAAPADLRDVLREAWAEGMFVPLQTYEVMATAQNSSAKGRKLVRTANKVVQVTASLFSFAERLNRLVTFIASARLATRPAVKANMQKVYGKNNLAKAMMRKWGQKSFAEFMIDETQFRMGKANRPVISRGLGAALMQFKGFVMQSLEVWFRMATQNGLAGAKAAALSIGLMAVIGGLWGMPGADDLRSLVEVAYKQVTKQDLDLKTEVRQQLYELTGQSWIGEVASKGATYPFGLDLSRIGMGNIAPDSPLQVFGIPADLFIGRPTRAFNKASQGDYTGAAGEFLPNFLKNPITAYGWSQNGVRDGAGRLSIQPEEIGAGEIVSKSLGFQPPQVSNVRDYEYAQRRMETGNDLLKRQYLDRIARTIAQQEKHPDKAIEAQAKRDEIQQELAEHNATAAPENQIRLTRTALKNRIQREMGGVEQTWGRERKQARGASEEMRKAFGLKDD